MNFLFQNGICDDNDDCFILTDEMTKLEEKAKEEEESDKPVFQSRKIRKVKIDQKSSSSAKIIPLESDSDDDDLANDVEFMELVQYKR